jgi:hypothetical protein
MFGIGTLELLILLAALVVLGVVVAALGIKRK